MAGEAASLGELLRAMLGGATTQGPPYTHTFAPPVEEEDVDPDPLPWFRIDVVDGELEAVVPADWWDRQP